MAGMDQVAIRSTNSTVSGRKRAVSSLGLAQLVAHGGATRSTSVAVVRIWAA